MIAKAKENFRGRDNFHFINANAESIPLESDFFDIIICTNSFHHYFDPVKALKEMRRLLKPGGKTFILDPTADGWFMKLADKLSKFFEPERMKFYSTREFQELFVASGLRYVDTKAVDMRQKVHIAERQR